MFGWAVELTAEIEAALTTERDPEAEATPCPSWRPHAREGCDDTGKAAAPDGPTREHPPIAALRAGRATLPPVGRECGSASVQRKPSPDSPTLDVSGQHQGKTSISGKGRPSLRLAAWRAVWAALPNNPVLAARFRYLTTREHNRLARQQARAACAAALLRWLHVVVTGRVRWDPAIAAGKKPAVLAA